MKRQDPAIKREELLQQISELFYIRGYEKTSIRDISKALGITNSGLYYYFKNKQEMLFTIIFNLFETALVDMRKNIRLFRNPDEKISWIIQKHIKFYAEHRAQTKVLVHERGSLEGRFAETIAEKEKEYVNFMKKTLQEIIGNLGVDIHVNVATFCLLGMLNWIVHWYNPEGKVSPERLADSMSTILLNGLKGKASKRNPATKRQEKIGLT